MARYFLKNLLIGVSLIVVALSVNYVTETIPFHMYKGAMESNFSVLCYNVRCSDENYEKNQIGIADEIIAASPDVVFLCEMNRSVSKGLDSLMTYRGDYKSYYRSGANCIFYSRYEIDSITGIDTETSKGKRALNNKVHVKMPQGDITVVGCHLSSSRKDFWEGRNNRARETDSIYQCIVGEEAPVIVMGDMNDISGTYTINRLKDAGLRDAWWEGGCGYGSTFHGYGLRLRIDHVLYQDRKLKLDEVKVIDSDFSDHNAVMAWFSFRS